VQKCEIVFCYSYPPIVEEEEVNEVVNALRDGWITIGPKVKRLTFNSRVHLGAWIVACLFFKTQLHSPLKFRIV